MNLTNLADIRALLARHDFRFSKSLGQNFLTAAWVPADIADASGADAHTGVLEVGPGIGCLTEQLAQRAGKVVSVELDERLRPVLAETLAGYENVELVFGDVLALDLPQLVAERFDGLRPVVCANLPYNVTSPLLTAFLTAGCFDTVTVMIQREVERRKTLVNALSAGVPGCDKARAAAAVAACGLDARVRGETLSLARFAALSDALGSELGNDAG